MIVEPYLVPKHNHGVASVRVRVHVHLQTLSRPVRVRISMPKMMFALIQKVVFPFVQFETYRVVWH